MPQQPSNGWTPVQEGTSPAPSGWTPVDESGAQGGLHLSDPSTVPNARIRNMPNPVDPSWSPGRSLYEGAKTGLTLGSIPASVESTIPGLVRGAIGAAAGGYGGKTLAKAAGAGEFGQEVAGDVGGVVGGGLSAGGTGTRVGKSAAAIARPATTVVEDLPVIGSVIKGAKAVKNISGDLADIWAKKPIYPGAPLPESPGYNPGAPFPEDPGTFPGAPLPETPNPELLKARALFEGTSSPSDPAAGLGTVKSGQISSAFKDPGAPLPETPDPQLLKARSLFEGSSSPSDPAAGLGNIKVAPGQAGQLAQSMKKQPAEVAPGFNRGALGDLLNKSLGAEESKVQPGKPIYQRSAGPPSGAISGAADLPEGHTAHQSSAIPSSMYDSGAKEFHARMVSGNTSYVYGDVSPEEAQAFTDAESKGKAFQQIKNGHPLVAKIVNGKRLPVKASQ